MEPDSAGTAVFRKRLRRSNVLPFFALQPPCMVALEACAGSHYWGPEISRLGHEVRLIPPFYVKPFVKRQKNDAADAEAICEASQRPTMRFVQIKSEAAQAAAVLFRLAICWCTNARKSSMPCAAISPSLGWWSRRDQRKSAGLSQRRKNKCAHCLKPCDRSLRF